MTSFLCPNAMSAQRPPTLPGAVPRKFRLAASLLLLSALSAGAVTWHNGITEQDTIDLAWSDPDFSSTCRILVRRANGSVATAGTGVLIADGWVLTARHLFSSDPPQDKIQCQFEPSEGASRTSIYSVAWHRTDSSTDLALVKLETDAPAWVPRVPPYASFDEFTSGVVGHKVGYGGIDSSGTSGNIRRAVTNRFNEGNDNYLYFTVDKFPPDTEYEGGTAPGDSGGPFFLNVDHQWWVSGITYGAVGPPLGLRESRVSKHREWIETITGIDFDEDFGPVASSLFGDSFNREGSEDADAGTEGMVGPAAPLTYSEFEDAASHTQVRNNRLYMAYGNNASTLGLDGHNFIDAFILERGGFRVSMEIADLGMLDDPDRYCGFGVGHSAAELGALGFDFNSNSGPRGRFDGSQSGAADFYLGWTPNNGGAIQMFTEASVGGTQIDVGAPLGGVLEAEFEFESFTAGSPVNVTVFFDGSEVATTSFTWTETNANFLALSCRQANGMTVNGLSVDLLPVPPSHHFADSFDRPDSTDLDAQSAGMTGTSRAVSYSESDTLPAANDESLSQILSNSLRLADGPNASVIGLSHNFTDPQILADGGFSVSMEIENLGSATDNNRWCGFGVGISPAELAALDLDFGTSAGPRGLFDGSRTGVADFFVGWTPNAGGAVQIFQQANTGGTQIPVDAGDGALLEAVFNVTSFSAGTPVQVTVYVDGEKITTTSFTWSDTDANHLALSCRQDGDGMSVDNLLVDRLPALSYDTWAEFYELTLGPDGDDDLDGDSNFLEYVSNGRPDDPSIKATKPTFLRVGDELQFSYLRRINDPALIYEVETCDDLSSWEATGYVELDPEDAAPGFERITVAIPIGPGSGFVRLQLPGAGG